MIKRIAALLAVAVSLSAAPYSRVVVFGDSLADTGHLFELTGHTYPPSPPYFDGRGSNGPLAVEYLSQNAGAPLVNFAVYGATTGQDNVVFPSNTGVLAQYSAAVAGGFAVNSNDLYVILGGPSNDFRSGLSVPALAAAITNQVSLVLALQAQGAQNIVLAGLPDLGLLPFVNQNGPVASALASNFSAAYNAQLQAALPAGVKFFDLSGLLQRLVTDPTFANTTDACLVGLTPCANPNQYVFWDDFHTTARVHQIAGAELTQLAGIPEPAAILTCASGFVVVIALRRRRRA